MNPIERNATLATVLMISNRYQIELRSRRSIANLYAFFMSHDFGFPIGVHVLIINCA